MSLSVSIMCLNGRRRNVKVSPNSTISQTLEDLCAREHLDSSKYSILFQRKVLDEALSWRYANVPNNAKLELIEQDKKKEEVPVKIAVQYEIGNRFQDSFLPSKTLWEILCHWESELLSLAPSDHEPSLLYLRQEISGIQRLSNTTLKSLGLTSGSAAFRLSFRPALKEQPQVSKQVVVIGKDRQHVTKVSKKTAPDRGRPEITQKMLHDALVEADAIKTYSGPRYDAESFKRDDMDVDQLEATPLAATISQDLMSTTSESSSSADFVGGMQYQSLAENETRIGRLEAKHDRVRPRDAGSVEAVPVKKFKPTPPSSPKQDFSGFKFPDETEGKDVYSAAPSGDDELDIRPLMLPCDRESIYYDEKEIDTPPDLAEDLGDEFYDLTVEDIRKMLAELKSVQRESEEKMLMTARSREMQRLRAINHYPMIVIRVVFPNRTILQGIFRPAEPLEALYDFVKSHLRDPRMDFYLYTAPPRVILKDMKSILFDNHLTPAAKVYFSLRGHEFHPRMVTDYCLENKGSSLKANASLQSVLIQKSVTDVNDDSVNSKK